MIRLITSYYIDSDSERQKEINLCLESNINNEHIDEIILLGKENPPLHNNKIKLYKSGRPTFHDFFSLVNNITNENEINILSNTDIFFDDSLIDLKQYPLDGKVLCLLRWEQLQNEEANIPILRSDCQDTWIFKGKVPIEHMWLDFNMGKLGCDNRLCYEFRNVGYTLENPCYLIKTYHLHNTKKRNYKETFVGQKEHEENKDVVPPPYQWVDPI